MRRILPSMLLLSACGSSGGDDCRVRATAASDVASTGAELVFGAPDALANFWDHPWPSDARRTRGRLLLRGFPNPTGSDTLAGYLDVVSRNTTAFSRNAAMYFHFDRALDPATLPATPAASVDAAASLFLVDVDPKSPTKGRRIPIDVHFSAAATVYLPPHHLTVLPPFGVSLAPGRTYAVVGTTAIRGADGAALARATGLGVALDDACAASDDAVVTAFAPLRTWLAEVGIAPEDVALATVFTTQDVVTAARNLGDLARNQPSPTVENLVRFGFREAEWLLTGELDLPAFQEGNAPYTNPTDGGGLALDADGRPMRTGSQRTRVAFVIPKGPMPERGWPVVLFAHGTGGGYDDVFSRDIGDQLAKRGIASMGYDGVVHGPRNPTGASVEISFFNLFNILAGRDNALQGAADNVVLTKLLRSGVEIPGELVDADAPVRFDADRVGYLGHSQGGLVGAPYVAMEPDLRAAVFSGTAGVLTITLEVRKDPVDFLGLLKTLLSLPPDEEVGDTHPVLTLIQTFIEAADPIAYGPSWLADPPGGRGRDVLMIEGLEDYVSPPRGHEALAAASGLPLVTPFHHQPEASALLGIEPAAAPARANVGGVTAGLIQYPNQTHFPIYDDADANSRAMEFLRSALIDGRAQIIAPSAP